MSSNGCIATSANQTNVYKGQYAVVQTKVDVSNIDIDTLQHKLPHIVGCLRAFGMGVYTIDYMQYVAATMQSNLLASPEKCPKGQNGTQLHLLGRKRHADENTQQDCVDHQSG